MQLLDVDARPFHSLTYRSAAEPAAAAPFFRARLSGVAGPARSIVATSDLQGREGGGGSRLLGEAVAETFGALQAEGAIPPIALCLLGGDLYADPAAARLGASGDVTNVFNAFAALAPTVGVLGNHDRLQADTLSPAARCLDGGTVEIAGLTIGGVGGIIGRADKPMRRPEDDFLQALEATARDADILVTHQGPDYPPRGEIGSPEIRRVLERRGAGVHLFGHARWSEPTARIGRWKVVNTDGRIYLFQTSE